MLGFLGRDMTFALKVLLGDQLVLFVSQVEVSLWEKSTKLSTKDTFYLQGLLPVSVDPVS